MAVIPAGVAPDLADYLRDLEQRLAELENPGSPQKVFACVTADMPSPADFYQCVLLNTTLNILAHSDGANWKREDTGASI